MQLINGTLNSPFFTFVKAGSALTDRELFLRLGLENYSLVTDKEYKPLDHPESSHLYLTEDRAWIHLMDDWGNTPWFNKEVRDRVKKLSLDFDIFSCSVGDVDASYDFRYYRKGAITREFEMEDPEMNGGRVSINTGQPLPGEEAVRKDVLEKVLFIASSLGIDIQHNTDKIRCYSRPIPKSDEFVFNEDEY